MQRGDEEDQPCSRGLYSYFFPTLVALLVLRYFTVLFVYFCAAFGDRKILLKCPQFKRMNQKLFSYSPNSSKKKFLRSFMIPIGGKLRKVENCLLLYLFLSTFGAHPATEKSYGNFHNLKQWIKNYFHITQIHLKKKLQDLFIIPTGGKLCNERMVTLRKTQKQRISF